MWLASLLILLSAAQAEEPPARQEARQRLQRILERETDRRGLNPEFEEWKKNWWRIEIRPPKLPEPEVKPSSARTPWLGLGKAVLYVILILVVAVCLAFAIHAFFVRRRENEATPAAAPRREETAAGPIDSLKKDPEEWLAEARAWVARGDYRQAVRFLLLSILGSLHRARQIQYERWKTNRECLAGYHGAPDQRTRFASIITLFEAAWYGRAVVTAGEYSAAESLAVELRRGAGHAP